MKDFYESNNKIKTTKDEYQDSAEGILKTVKAKEFLENELEVLKNKYMALEEILSNQTIAWTIVRYIGIVIITLLALPILYSLLFQRNLYDLLMLLGGFKGYFSVFTPIVAFGLSPICIKKCNEINYYKKEKNSIESQIGYIKAYLQALEIKLKDLSNVKTYDNDQVIKMSKRIDYNNIKRIKAILALIEDAGFEEKKYLEYLKKGILRERLSKYYEENEINVIEYYIDKKAKSLEKKYKV